MSDESELGVVLANAPIIQKAFGRSWAALITLVSLYFARPRSGLVGLIASLLVVLALSDRASKRQLAGRNQVEIPLRFRFARCVGI